MKKQLPMMRPLGRLCLVSLLLASPGLSPAANIPKANNNNALNLVTSWVGGNVPGAADIALWDTNVVLGAAAIYPTGGNLTWNGLAIGAYGPYTNNYNHPNTGSGNLITFTNPTVNTLTLGAAGLDLSLATNNLTLTNLNIVLNATQTWNIFNGRTVTVGGNISGPGQLIKEGNGALILNGTNGFNTPLVLGGGLVTLNFPSSLAPTNNILNPAQPLVLDDNGGALLMTGKAGTTNSQTLNGVNLLTGLGLITSAPGGAGGSNYLNLGLVSRAVGGGALNFGPLSATGPIVVANTNDASGILGPWAAIASSTTYGGGGGISSATNWACVTTNGVVTNYTGWTLLTGTGPTLANNPLSNVKIDNNSTGTVTVGAGTTTVNTVLMSGSTARTLDIPAGNTLRLGENGGILKASGSGSTFLVGASAVTPGTLTAGGAPNTPGELMINDQNGNNNRGSGTMTINSTITDNGTGPVTVSFIGGDQVQVYSTNTYSGGTYIVGRVQLENGARFGTGPIYVKGLPLAAFIQAGFQQIGNYAVGGTLYFNGGNFTNDLYLEGCGAVDAAGGVLRNVGSLYGTIHLLKDTVIPGGNYYGNIVGNGNLYVRPGGTANFYGTNAYTGNTILMQSTLADHPQGNVAGNPGGLPPTTVVVIGQGAGVNGTAGNGLGNTLFKLFGNEVIAGLADGTFMCPPPYYRSVDVNSGSGAVTLTLSNNVNNLFYSGTISNTFGTLSLVKDGSFTQTLGGTNTFTGGVTVLNGTLTMANANSLGNGPVTVVGGAISFGTLTNVSFGGLNGFNPLALVNASGVPVTLGVGTGDGQTYTMAGPLTGPGSFVKNGQDYEYLAGTNTYTGNTVVNAGTLYLAASGSIARSAQIVVASGAILDASASGVLTLNGAAGQVLSGSGSVNGVVTASSGSTVSPGGPAGTLVLNNDYNLSGGVTNLFNLSSDPTGGTFPNAKLQVSGNLNLSGSNPVIINPYLLSLGNGEYPLIQYGTLASGSVANLQLQPIAGYSMYLTNDVDLSAIAVVVVPGHTPASITWRGNGVNNYWNLTSANWYNGGLVDFYNGDSVTFDDTGSTSPAVNLTTSVGPVAMEVNATRNYTLSGTGYIGGTMTLTKDGTGTLVLANNNTYTGGTTINSGTVQVGNGGSAGALGSGPINDNSALIYDLNGVQTLTNTLAGAGNLALAGGGTYNFDGDASGFAGPVAITNATVNTVDFVNLGYGNTLTLNGGSLNLSATGSETPNWDIALGAGGGTLSHVITLFMGDGINNPITGNGSFTKAGPGKMVLVTSNTYSGPTIVAGGILQVDSGGTTAWIPNGLALTGGSVVYERSDSYYQNGLISSSSGGSSITVSMLGAGNTNYLDFAPGTNILGNIANFSGAGTLILDGSPSSQNFLGTISNSTSAVLELQGGVWNMSAPFVPGGSELDFNGGTAVVINTGGNGMQNFNVPNVVINSGGLILGAGGRYSNGSDNQSLTVNGGVLVATNTTYGFRFGNNQGAGNNAGQAGYYGFTAVQTGGWVYAPGNGEQRLSIGGSGPATAGDNDAWTMTGGQIVVTNAGPTGASLWLGADAAGVATTTFSLSGTGQLQLYSLAGAQAGANQVFNWSGGTITAFAIDASNLQATNNPGVAGTLYNNGGTLVPGGYGSAGLTTITGNYDITARGAVLDIDLGGLAQGNTFTGSTNASDYVQVTQSAVLGGSLILHRLNGFEPIAPAGQSIVILTATNITGTFNNLDVNGRIPLAGDATRSYHVTITSTNVTLDHYQTPTPQAYFTYNPATGTTPLVVTFTNLANGAGLTNWWSFGDGSTSASAAATVVHTYSGAGSNTVSLTVGSALGANTYTVSNAVVVTAPAGPTGPASLTNSLSGNVLTLSWPAGLNWRLVSQTNTLANGLNSATNSWYTVTGSTATNSATFTLDPRQGTVFYRLVYP